MFDDFTFQGFVGGGGNSFETIAPPESYLSGNIVVCATQPCSSVKMICFWEREGKKVICSIGKRGTGTRTKSAVTSKGLPAGVCV